MGVLLSNTYAQTFTCAGAVETNLDGARNLHDDFYPLMEFTHVDVTTDQDPALATVEQLDPDLQVWWFGEIISNRGHGNTPSFRLSYAVVNANEGLTANSKRQEFALAPMRDAGDGEWKANLNTTLTLPAEGEAAGDALVMSLSREVLSNVTQLEIRSGFWCEVK